MATVTELKQCFEAFRDNVRESNADAKQHDHARGTQAVRERERLVSLTFIGIFLLESLLIDIKRIADAAETNLDQYAHDAQNEPKRWTGPDDK